MAKWDPKILKKINQSELILAAKSIGIENAEKVKKENLASVFMKKVDGMSNEEKTELEDIAIKVFNHILTISGEADTGEDEGNEKEEGGEKEMEKESVKEKVKGKGKKAPEKVQQKVEKDKKKVDQYTRIDAICDAVRKIKGGEIAKVAILANELYVAKGGRNNELESKFATRIVVGGLRNWGVLEGDTKTFKIVK